jgi:hypothetical protein
VAHWVRIGSLIAAGVGVAIVVWGISTLRLAFADLGAKRQVDGEIVRCRALKRGESDFNYFAAIDDGTSLKIKAWLLDKETYDRLHEGDIVHATLSRHFRHVYQIETVKASRQVEPPAADTRANGAAGIGPAAAMMVAAPAIGPEGLITAEDAAAALGEPVKPAQDFTQREQAASLPHACIYAAASGREAGVIVAAASGPMVGLLARVYTHRTGDAIDVPAGHAYVHGNAVAVLTANTAVLITLQGATGDSKAALLQLATLAAQRLAGATPAPSPDEARAS